MRILTMIAARRDSKGIPGKNWKMLGGRPLISWSIEAALEVSNAEDICISTNSQEVIDIARNTYGLDVPFVRPEHLSSDTSTSREAILHAIDYYRDTLGKHYDALLQLQPTAPFRTKAQIEGCIHLFKNRQPEMVMSAYIPNLNPYYNLYSEDENGYIGRAIPSPYIRRQDCPPVYALNGSIYVMDIATLRQKEVHAFEKVMKYVVPARYGIDLDTEEDWDLAEYLISKNRF
ncbi:MAG: acylneuraminate cytidylyltransferase family protein [Bacteroidetes bacterium]|nr:acylneuraminate cytidylyltransferase family protein [Bacteroidota bacterium]